MTMIMRDLIILNKNKSNNKLITILKLSQIIKWESNPLLIIFLPPFYSNNNNRIKMIMNIIMIKNLKFYLNNNKINSKI